MGDSETNGHNPGETTASGEEKARRLPPPAFPTGARRSDRDPEGTGGGVPGAIISPDDPIPFRAPRAAEGEADLGEPEEGVVTGIGDDPHLDPLEVASQGDPFLREVVEQVSKLAEALRRRGEAGLKMTPGMSRLEATLRAYCVGYLAGRRAEAEED